MAFILGRPAQSSGFDGGRFLPKKGGEMNPYIRIARPDHWIKNIFVFPGVLLALGIGHGGVHFGVYSFVMSMVAVCVAASANYTINEFLDREFDRHHPEKCSRPGAQGELSAKIVFLQFTALVATSMGLAFTINLPFFFALLWLLVMGVLYNVPPIRTKDRVYLDVLSESVNNPIRLLLGWFMVTSGTLPPSSILLSYWMGGAVFGRNSVSSSSFHCP